MTVNPSGAIAETGSAPNTVELNPATFSAGPVPCFIIVSVRSYGGPLYAVDGNFDGILERATSLLPSAGFGNWKIDRNPIEKLVYVADPCWCWPPVKLWRWRPFDMDNADERQHAMDSVERRRFWCYFSPGFGCTDFHYLGALHACDTSSFNGKGNRPGCCLVARMQFADNRNDCLPASPATPAWQVPFGGNILAHELGHNYGRKHIDQSASFCGGNMPGGELDDSYPGDPCQLGVDLLGLNHRIGFDPISRKAICTACAGDLMSYAPSTWISKYTFNAIRSTAPTALALAATSRPSPAPKGPQGGGPVLLIQAEIFPAQNRAELMPFYVLPEGVADPGLVAQSLTDAAQLPPTFPYRLRLLDAAGNLLSDTDCVLTEAAGTGPTTYGVNQFLGFPAATRRLQLLKDGVVLLERFVSAHAPQLTVQPPMFDAPNQTVTLNWTASDLDNDVLVFAIQYSPDGGATWLAQVADHPYLSLTLSTEMLPGSGAALFRVFATDGVNTTFAVTPPFALPRHPPQTLIGGVAEGQRVPFGRRLDLRAVAIDAEDGSALNQSWSISGPVSVVARGRQVALDEFSPGAYTATLTAVDSDNNAMSAMRSFEILPLTIPEGPAPLLDGLCDDAGYTNAARVRLPLANGEFAQAFLLHSGSNLFVCLTGLQFPVQGASVVGLRVDADNSRDSFAAPGDLGFFVDSDGFPYQEAGTGNGMAVTYSPQKGFVAVIERGSNSWTAEFVIADSLIGGWNHAAGIMLAHDAARWPPLAADGRPVTWSPAYFGATLPPQPNRPPFADAGPNQIVNVAEPTTVFLNGSGSADADGDPLTFTWTQIAGPTVVLSNPSNAAPSFVVPPALSPATLRFSLAVSDGTLAGGPALTEVKLLSPPSQSFAEQSPVTQAGFVSGGFQLRLVGQPGAKFAIFASTNLMNWELLATRFADF